MITYAEKPWLNCYEEQVPAELDFPEIALHQWLEEAAEEYPKHAAIIFQGRKITYQELNELADAVAAALVANGFNKGDRAVIYMANTPQFVGTYVDTGCPLNLVIFGTRISLPLEGRRKK
jgi:long-chain acyl-CoA synthetase